MILPNLILENPNRSRLNPLSENVANEAKGSARGERISLSLSLPIGYYIYSLGARSPDERCFD